MDYSITILLKRDRLEEDFKVSNQQIHCDIAMTKQMFDFIENIVNANVKSKECFIIKAPCSLSVYTSYIRPYVTFKKELSIFFLETYDNDIIKIEPKTQIF